MVSILDMDSFGMLSYLQAHRSRSTLCWAQTCDNQIMEGPAICYTEGSASPALTAARNACHSLMVKCSSVPAGSLD